MGIRTEVARKMAGDVGELRIQSEQHIDQPRRITGLVIECDEEMEAPEPRYRTNSKFEHARTVGARKRRIGVKPAGEVSSERVTVSAVARQPGGSPELQPSLMPVYFPDHLVIATRRVEIRNASPEFGGGTSLMDRIEEPVDLRGRTN